MRVVIFDLDGTLADTFPDIAAAVNVALSGRGLPAQSLESISKMVGAGIGELCRRAAPVLGESELPAFVEEVRRAYQATPVRDSRAYSGVLVALRELRARGYSCAVLSNKPHALTVLVCEHLGFAPYLDAVVGEDAPHTPPKPDPTGGRRVMEQLGAHEIGRASCRERVYVLV